jgi:hypothetical protein
MIAWMHECAEREACSAERRIQEIGIRSKEESDRRRQTAARNNKLLHYKTCPPFFGGKITNSNDQNNKRKKCPVWNLRFVIWDLSLKKRGTSFDIWCLRFVIFTCSHFFGLKGGNGEKIEAR